MHTDASRHLDSDYLQPTTPTLEVQQLGKSYTSRQGTVTVLEDINLQVQPRELVCLVGASGCGKSTLLNIIAGLVPSTSGQVRVEGEVVTGPGADRGMVFQNYTLYPWLTVAQNIAFGLQLRRLPNVQQRERVSYFLDMVGLTDWAHVYPKQLSGGMKQRVAIARALVNEPQVLLMDEPFGALDAQTKEQMQQFLMNLWRQTHTTILMITHDIEEAVFLSQRVYVMDSNPGRLQQEIVIPFAADRDLETKLSPDFIAVKRQVLQALQPINDRAV
jgi:NitT/TauT family transport system ATP-binding protein